MVGSLLSSGVAVLIANISRRECIANGSCFPASVGVLSGSSFVMCAPRVSWIEPMQTYFTQNAPPSDGVLSVCAPGMNVFFSKVQNIPVCQLERTFPSSFNVRIGVQNASSLSRAACGVWMDSIEPSHSNELTYLGLRGARESVESMIRITRFALGDLSTSTSNMVKFMYACEQLAMSPIYAMQADVMQGYQRLMHHIDTIGTPLHAFSAAAVLLGFGCDGFLDVSTHIDAGGFVLQVQDSPRLPTQLVEQALLLVNEPSLVVQMAGTWFDGLQTSKVAPCGWTPTRDELYQLIVTASLLLDDVNSEKQTNDDLLTRAKALRVDPSSLYTIRRLVCTVSPSLTGSTLNEAEAAIKGAAAVCAASVMINRYDARWETPLWSQLREFAHKRRASMNILESRALGRMPPSTSSYNHQRNGVAPLSVPNMWKNTTQQTLGMLVTMVDARLKSTRIKKPPTCEDVSRSLFPEEMDRVFHRATVPKMLYDRVELMTHRIQQHMATLLKTNPDLRNLFESPDSVLSAIKQSRLINTGISRPVRVASITSSDGPTTQGLLQSAMMTSDRLHMAISQRDVCEHPSLMDPEDINAYYLHPFGCIHVSVGMLLMPFADHAYDEFSLLANLGFVIAHEVGHSSSSSRLRAMAIDNTLRLYENKSRMEALSDLLAAMTLMSLLGIKDYTRFTLYQAQLWCVKPGRMYTYGNSSIHPDPVTRFILLCKTISAIDGYQCHW